MGKVRTVSSHDQKRLMELNGVLISKRKSNLLVAMEIMRVGGRKGAGWLSRVGDKRTAESRRVGVGGEGGLFHTGFTDLQPRELWLLLCHVESRHQSWKAGRAFVILQAFRSFCLFGSLPSAFPGVRVRADVRSVACIHTRFSSKGPEPGLVFHSGSTSECLENL